MKIYPYLNKNEGLHAIFSCLLCAAILFWSSCSKDIKETNLEYPALAPSNLDLNADTWKPVLISSATAFTVQAPDALKSAAYTGDLNEIKGYQKNLTSDQRSKISYWGAGAVLRWNEILRELVTKHNLPPYQNEDGSYPVPNASNPLAYPTFPFSNPPYAARAYAYVSAAQYDALIAAYYYKKQFNRSAPYVNDPGVQALLPKSSLPSYPSEDGVISGAAVEMLKLLFPGDVSYIEQKQAEQKLARMMAGVNTRAELEAGDLLGRQVADVFVARAQTDRAGKAGGNPAFWKQLETTATTNGEQCWLSLESPRRPPQLPLFGKVKPFLFDTLTVVALRAPKPYSTNSDEFKKETAEVKSFADNPTREHQSLVNFWADGPGTYSPAGHWDAIASDEFVKQNYSEVRWARNMALLNMAEMDAAIVCWNTKYFYFNPRPTQTDASIKTLTGIPNFPSYISGHSSFSGAAATVLSYLLPDRGSKFNDLASQAGLSRLYGAIHTRSDCAMGLVTGNKVGSYSVARGKIDGADQGSATGSNSGSH